MKCQYCNGKGRVEYPMYADNEQTIQNAVLRFKTCAYCNGTGEVTMTNEEYIRQCSTEELAEFITKAILSDRRFRMTMIGGIEETKAWLKEKHND